MSSAGNIVGGVAGVGISIMSGGVIPPNVGWMVGSVVGGLAFPPKGLDGPKSGDAKVQGSEWGRPIPWVFGIDAVAGNAIWRGPIVEREGDSGGGKGGSEPTTSSYFGNFAVLICEGRPDADGNAMALGRILAGPDKRLVYDPSGTGQLEGGGTLRFYAGTMDQLPDPLIEAHEGVGNVPAWRGWCYVVFEDFPLNNDGNTIPFLTIEVGRQGNTAPESLGLVWWGTPLVGEQYVLAPYYGSNRGVIVRDATDFSFVANRSITFPESGDDDMHVLDEDRGVFIRMPENALSYRVVDILTGSSTQHTLTGVVAGDIVHGIVYHNGSYIFAVRIAATGDTKIVLVDPATNTVTSSYTFTEAGGELLTGPCLRTVEGANYVICATTSKIRRYDLDGSIASVDLGAKARTVSTLVTNAVRVDPSTGVIWSVAKRRSETTLYVNVTHADTGLMLASTVTTLIQDLVGDPLLFVPGDAGLGRPARVYVVGNKGGTYTDYYEEFDPDAGGYIAGHEGTYHGINDLQAALYVPGLEKLVGLRYGGGDYALSTSLDPTTIPLSTGYMGGADSSLSGETLAQVVTAISEAVDLTAADIDVSELTDQVDGFKIASQMRASEALAALAPVYYFDGVESGTKVKFVKRGGAIAATIPDEDLGAYESDSEPVDVVETTRKMEDELPRTVTVNYSLRATDYSPATRYARRLIGSTGDELTLDLPLVLSDTKAQEVAEVNLYSAHAGRIEKKFSLGRAYGYLEPTDVVVVKEERVRIQRMVQAGAIYRCEAVRDDAQAVVPNVVVTETPDRDQTVETASLTRLELM